jgi:hypothetical protein
MGCWKKPALCFGSCLLTRDCTVLVLKVLTVHQRDSGLARGREVFLNSSARLFMCYHEQNRLCCKAACGCIMLHEKLLEIRSGVASD